tara:strand:+ start:1383 stop:2513 length:1131 start_codon:yes stop_codon:yes gene_type:complete
MNLEEEVEDQKDFWFPKEDKRVQNFSTLTTKEQLEVIEIGYIMRDIGINEAKRIVNGEKRAEMDCVKDHYENILNEKTEKIQELKNINTKIKRSKSSEIIEKTEEIKTQTENKYKKMYEEEIKRLKDDIFNLKQEEKKQRMENIELIKKHNQKEMEQAEKYSERIAELLHKSYESSLANENSSKKGDEGENWLYNECHRQFKSACVEHVGKQAHMGDFTVKEGNIMGMIESKNYSRNVKKSEVEKFERDMKDNDDFAYGIFCSLKSGIVDKKETFTIDFVLGKPVVYITNLKNKPDLLYIARLNCLYIIKNKDDYDIAKEEDQSKLKEIFKKRMKRLKKRKKMIENREKQIKEDKKILDEDMQEEFQIKELINVTY